jgi:DNA modification methylase
MNKIEFGDNRQTMKKWAEEGVKVQTCVTSPPYYGLRDYGTANWVGGDPKCSHYRENQISDSCNTGHASLVGGVGDGIYKKICKRCGAMREDLQLGLEETPEEYIANMVDVFRHVRDIMADDGTVWLNIGDSYYNYRPGKGQAMNKQTVSNTEQDLPQTCARRGNKLDGLKEKDLIGIPWMLAFALRADGWYLRQDIIWHKPNPMPESVKDRCTKAHEYIFLLSKSKNYYFDNDAIKEPIQDESALRLLRGVSDSHKNVNGAPGQTPHSMNKPRTNARKEFDGSMGGGGTGFIGHSGYKNAEGELMVNENRNKRSVWTVTTKPYSGAHFAVFPSDLIEPCILAGAPVGGIVLDPFMGSGTTAQVAQNLGRQYMGCELNLEYKKLQDQRLAQESFVFE